MLYHFSRATVLVGAASAAFLFAGAALASASTVGLPVPAEGSVIWDTFPSTTFTGRAPNSDTSAPIDGYTLASNLPTGGSPTGSGERLYNGATFPGTQDAAFDFDITGGSLTAGTDTFSLALKSSGPSTGRLQDFFTVKLNGLTGTMREPVNSGESIGSGTMASPLYVVQWIWTGLNLAAGSTPVFSIDSPVGGNVSVDAIQISTGTAAAVPEPGSALLLTGSLSALVGLRRFRSRRA